MTSFASAKVSPREMTAAALRNATCVAKGPDGGPMAHDSYYVPTEDVMACRACPMRVDADTGDPING
jgi:hypothetical protein